MLRRLSKKAGFVLAVFGAAVVGGISTALVRAAVPGSSGQINACYVAQDGVPDPAGKLRVIDTEAAQTCGSNETALSWAQSAPVLHDADGQVLGDTIGYSNRIDYGADYNVMRVFNRALNRVISFQYNAQNIDDPHFVFGEYASTFFQSTDCTGQAYIGKDPALGLKTLVFRVPADPSDGYAIVADNAEESTVMARSSLSRSAGGELTCRAYDENVLVDQFYPLTTVSLPFTTPIATPFKF